MQPDPPQTADKDRPLHRNRRTLSILSIAAAATLLAAACGDGPSGESEAATTPPSSVPEQDESQTTAEPVDALDPDDAVPPSSPDASEDSRAEPAGEAASGEGTSAGDERIGYELLERMDDGTLRAWVSNDSMTLEEFEAIDLPDNWLKNQPRETSVDGGRFVGSPGADGMTVSEDLFGHSWFHAATVVEIGVPVDDDGLLAGSLVEKSHEISFEPGSTAVVLVSPDGDSYVRIGRDAGRTSDDPSLPAGWEIVEVVVADGYTALLPDPTLVIRTDNQDSFQGPVTGLSTNGPTASTDPYADLALHAGYWIFDESGPIDEDGGTLESISVHHVDMDTRRMTVYSQTVLTENTDTTGSAVVISPPQLDPGTCGASPANGQTVCAHANAVYLDGSGQEQPASNGEGSWWIEHSWVLDGEGYRNCQAMPPPTELLAEDTDCTPVIGTWQDDELTMHLGLDDGTGEVAGIYNERRPLLDRDPVAYLVNRVDTRPDAAAFTIEFSCVPDQPSPLDGMVLGCPAPELPTP